MNDEIEAIRAVHDTWIEAVNAGDFARLLAMVTDDLVLLGPGEAPIGKEGFAAKFTGAHKQYLIACASVLEDVQVAGDVAYTLCRDDLSVTPRAGGETARLAGHRITVYRKAADGRWLLARDAHTLARVQ
ncbi:MAG: SnoaL-like domain protein [Pseudoduganella sp.]|jgi:uncharacterized protein (TIGR02246 family)|nr:SnoaL-like domain protein [Pseudoduganella sp.]